MKRCGEEVEIVGHYSGTHYRHPCRLEKGHSGRHVPGYMAVIAALERCSKLLTGKGAT